MPERLAFDGHVAENHNELPEPLTNRAGESRSPYVRGHMNNPVAWQLWDDATIARAKKENKLLFISIGYSACHCTLSRIHHHLRAHLS